MTTCPKCGTPLATEEQLARGEKLKAQSQTLARGGTWDWDALAATLGKDVAVTIREAVERRLPDADRGEVEHVLLSVILRKEARRARGEVERRELDAAISSVRRACHRLRRDYPWLEVMTGLVETADSLPARAQTLRATRRGRPSWRAEAEAALRALGARPAAIGVLIDLLGLDGPTPTTTKTAK